MTREDEERWEKLGIEAQELARAGQVEQAVALITRIPRPNSFAGWSHERTVALIVIAAKLIEQGHEERALAVANEALECCEALHEGATWEEADCYANIASLIEKLNVRSTSLSIWKKASEAAQNNQSFDIDCIKILAKIGRDLADIGEIQFATDVARSIRLAEIRESTLNYVLSRAAGKKQ